MVYDAYKVDPNDMPPPAPDNKWKRKVVFGVGALSVAVIIAAVVGSLVTTKNETDSSGGKGVGSADYSSPTEAPTLPPAPLNCTIKDMGPVWPEDYCNWCDIVLGRDGDTIVITNSNSYAPEGEIIKGFEVLVGPFRMESHVPSDAMMSIAFSDTHFFAADPLDWKAGAVVRVSPKGPSGEILEGAAVDVRPAPGNTEEMSMICSVRRSPWTMPCSRWELPTTMTWPGARSSFVRIRIMQAIGRKRPSSRPPLRFWGAEFW